MIKKLIFLSFIATLSNAVQAFEDSSSQMIVAYRNNPYSLKYSRDAEVAILNAFGALLLKQTFRNEKLLSLERQLAAEKQECQRQLQIEEQQHQYKLWRPANQQHFCQVLPKKQRQHHQLRPNEQQQERAPWSCRALRSQGEPKQHKAPQRPYIPQQHKHTAPMDLEEWKRTKSPEQLPWN